MLVGNGVEEPLNVVVAGYDARQTEHLEGWVVGMDTHIHVALFANGHDGLKEILHVGAQLVAVDALIEGKQLTEQLHGMLVVLLEVAAHEALCLDDNVLHQGVVLLGCHGASQLLHLLDDVAAVRLSVGSQHLKTCPVVLGALAFQNVDVEISKLWDAEIQVAAAVGIVVKQAQSSTGLKL